MTKILETFTNLVKIKFSTNENIAKSKTKCMAHLRKHKVRHLGSANLREIILNGAELPWVSSYKYLGSVITNDDDILEKDMNIKKGIFISNNHRLIQEFRWVGSRNLSNILKIYNASIYGSNLYDLNHHIITKIVSAYNNAVRMVWGIPRCAHRYWVEVLSGTHMLTSIKSNQIGFMKRVKSINKQI